MPRFSSSVLREYAKEIFVALGTPNERADLVGRLLVESNPPPFVSSEVETPCATLVACFSTALETSGAR